MDIYLIEQDGTKFHFPVNPQTIQLNGAKIIETVQIINRGEVDFITGDKRSSVQFSSFFPYEYDPAYCRYADIQPPRVALDKLINMRLKAQPVRLIVTETQINTLVIITDVNHKQDATYLHDLQFDISMRTWVEAKVRTVADLQTSDKRSDKAPSSVYTVKFGDTLYGIAKTQLNDSSRWQDIYNANVQVIGKDPNTVVVGQKLVLPS